MGIRFPFVVIGNIKQKKTYSRLTRDESDDVPKGHFAVYVGRNDEKRRFVIPLSYLKHPSFVKFLQQAEEEFGFDHPMGGLTIPCEEDAFLDFTSRLKC